MQKAVNVQAKAGLKSSDIVQDSDICCPKGHRPSNSITSKVQTQVTTGKISKLEKSRLKESKLAEVKNPVALRSKSTEPRKISCIDKKKKYFKKKRDWKNNTPAIRDNANAIEVGEKNWNNRGNKRCYNY